MAKAIGKKYSLGSIVAIPLQSGKFAYAKIFSDLTFGIYGFISNELMGIDNVICHPIVFYQAGTDRAVKSGEWPIIGCEPFPNSEYAWGPPQATWYDRDANEWTGGVPRVNDKGVTRVATFDEVRGLDILTVCHRPDLMVDIIIDRLVSGNNEKYKVRS